MTDAQAALDCDADPGMASRSRATILLIRWSCSTLILTYWRLPARGTPGIRTSTPRIIAFAVFENSKRKQRTDNANCVDVISIVDIPFLGSMPTFSYSYSAFVGRSMPADESKSETASQSESDSEPEPEFEPQTVQAGPNGLVKLPHEMAMHLRPDSPPFLVECSVEGNSVVLTPVRRRWTQEGLRERRRLEDAMLATDDPDERHRLRRARDRLREEQPTVPMEESEDGE